MEKVPEVAVCGIDRERGLLLGADGQAFREWEPNTWVVAGEEHPGVVYLGTGRHGGGIVLRPLFVRDVAGWRNASTGARPPAGVALP